MIIRKIIEYDEKCKVEKILLICDDKDEGWEMTDDELMTLRGIIDKAYPPAASPPHTPISNQMLVDKNWEIAKLNENIEVLCTLDATHCDEIDQLKVDLNRNVLERDRLMERLSMLSTEKKTLEAELKEKEKYIDEASKTYTLITDEKHVLYEEVKRLEKKLEEMTIGKLISPGETLEAEKEIFREQNYDFPRIKRERRDYTKYIKMYRDGAEQKEIEESLAEDFGIAKSTATQNYYSKVKAEALKQIENEKVVIVDENKPAPGKFFTDAERKRIQEAARIK